VLNWLIWRIFWVWFQPYRNVPSRFFKIFSIWKRWPSIWGEDLNQIPRNLYHRYTQLAHFIYKKNVTFFQSFHFPVSHFFDFRQKVSVTQMVEIINPEIWLRGFLIGTTFWAIKIVISAKGRFHYLTLVYPFYYDAFRQFGIIRYSWCPGISMRGTFWHESVLAR